MNQNQPNRTIRDVQVQGEGCNNPKVDQPMGMNTCAPYEEPDTLKLVRLEKRLNNLNLLRVTTGALLDNVFEESENTAVELENYRSECLRMGGAIERARESFKIFTPELDGIFAVLGERIGATNHTLHRVMEFIEKALEPYAIYDGPIVGTRPQEIADALVLLHRALLSARQYLDGKSDALFVPLPANGPEISLTLEGIRNEMRRRQEEVRVDTKPQSGIMPTVFYCHACKRHVAPEDLEQFAPEPRFHEVREAPPLFRHSRNHGCGCQVSVRHAMAEGYALVTGDEQPGDEYETLDGEWHPIAPNRAGQLHHQGNTPLRVRRLAQGPVQKR